MDAPLALHTAARRWLMERHARWAERFAEIGGGNRTTPTPRDLDTFPRFHAAEAMLEGVESLRPEEPASLADARERIAAAATGAQTMFTEAPHGEIEARAMAEERAAFAAFVRGVGEAELARVEPLPYRRVLGREEERAIWDEVRERWDVNGYWHPLGETSRADVAAYADDEFRRAVGGGGLRRILEGRGVRRVWEIREYGPSYEIDPALLDPVYTGAEGYWCASGLDWLVYASHEESVTVGGAWLIAEVEAAWPEWERHLWRRPP